MGRGGPAVGAVVLAVPGLAAPASFSVLIDPVPSFFAGNELPFPSGFPFAIAHRSTEA